MSTATYTSPDGITITEIGQDTYEINEGVHHAGCRFRVQGTRAGKLAMTDTSSAERHIAIRMLDGIGRPDLADRIRNREHVEV